MAVLNHYLLSARPESADTLLSDADCQTALRMHASKVPDRLVIHHPTKDLQTAFPAVTETKQRLR